MNVPAPQLEHSTSPLMLKEPGAQHWPAPLDSAERPGAHATHAVPPVRSMYVLRGQGAQAVAPRPLDTEPMGHVAHARMELAVAEAL